MKRDDLRVRRGGSVSPCVKTLEDNSVDLKRKRSAGIPEVLPTGGGLPIESRDDAETLIAEFGRGIPAAH